MASSTTTTPLSPQEREEARKALRERKAQSERERRAKIARAKDALEKAGLPRETELDREQRDRAAESAEKKGGLSGNALQVWILEGKTSQDVIAEAREEQAAEERSERTRANVTRSQDPAAASLAVEAKSLAPEIKSAFLPKDAREFLDIFEVQLAQPTTVTVRRTDNGGSGDITLNVRELERFARQGEKIPEVRSSLASVGKGSRLWGRKLGLMVLAQRLRLKGASA